MDVPEHNIRLPAKWVELNITKRECSTFLATLEDEILCQCGRRKIDHGDFVKLQHRPEPWIPSLHTRVFSTDAYGTILFEGEHHPNKAHFVRLSYDTNPEIVVQLMKYVWGLQMPKLIISVLGGSSNFHLNSRLGKIFQFGLIKAATSTSAWVFSGGFNSGVARHLGKALNEERWIGGTKRGRIVSVGIAPWGMCEHRQQLIGRNKERSYSPLEYSGSKFLHLNPRHSNFLLVDNGSIGKFGGENYLRRRLEKCISTYPTSPNRGCDIPVVVVVLEGAFHTLRMIHEYLYDEPPIPVVIFDGTGKCADLISWVIRRFPSEEALDENKVEIMKRLVHVFHNVSVNQCPELFREIKGIFHRRSLITVFNPNSTSSEQLDSIILASIFRSQHWSPLQQLSLSLCWGRVDIAHNEVFVYGREWSREHLEFAMHEALVMNRVDFVNLLLEHGLNMQNFLTASRLEVLYGSDCIQSKLMETLLTEFAQIKTSRRSKKSGAYSTNLTLHDIAGIVDEQEVRAQTFPRPFDDLFVWTILTKRHDMAKLFWVHGYGALAKTLVAVKLNKYIAQELRSSEATMTNLVDEFENYAEEWETLSVSLLDACYRQDSTMARQLLTMELENWSKLTCLTLAVMANHRMLLGHPCCQILLLDLWMGALNLKSSSMLKIILGIIFPPFALCLDYKSTEELRLLPHLEKEQSYHNLHFDPNAKYEEEYVGGSSFEMQNSTQGDNEDKDSDIILAYGSRNKSQNSLTSVFRNRNEKLRKTDLADVVSKIGLNKTNSLNPSVNFAGGDGKTLATLTHPHSPAELGHEISCDLPGHHTTADNYHAHSPHHKHLGNQFRFSSFVKTEQNLSMWNKFVEFQVSPLVNFCRHSIAYLIFILALTYVILYPQDHDFPGWVEMYMIACIVTEGLECIRQFIEIDALSFSQKLAEIKSNLWQVADYIAINFVLVGVILRFSDGYYDYGMFVYRTSSIYWNLRLYKYMEVHRFIGPKILMMSEMVSHMACFAMIILVVILSFGIARESIRFPDLNPSVRDLAEAFLEPYTMMFGEVDLDALSPQCGDDPQDNCPLGAWLIPVAWVVYMMVANILVMNVLIAVYNGIYMEINANAVSVWMFQRFTFVMEFERKPLLPPPFIIISHLISVIRFIFKRCIRLMCEESLLEEKLDEDEKPHITTMGNDHSLKSFLSGADQHMVFDFEEENMDTLRHLLYKEHDKSVSVAENTFGYALTSEKLAVHQLKLGLDELCGEMECQKQKIDKLISCWELNMQENQQSDDSQQNSNENIILGPVSQYSWDS